MLMKKRKTLILTGKILNCFSSFNPHFASQKALLSTLWISGEGGAFREAKDANVLWN